MKILLLTYEYAPFHGGIGTYLETLARSVPSDVDISVAIPPQDEHWAQTVLKTFWRSLKRKPDLIAVSHVLPAGYVAWKMKVLRGIPYIVFTHGTDILSARKSPWKRFWMRFILKSAKFAVANSHFTAGLLKEEGISRVEIVTPAVPDWAEETAVKPQASERSGKTIVSVGRLVERKGFDTGIEALEIVRREIPDAIYVIIGNGPYRQKLERMINERNLGESVKILSDVPDVSDYLSHADVFILPARQVGGDIEGFGIVNLEASASGLPVVVARSGGAAEAVIDGTTGLVVEPNNPKSLAAAVVRLLKDPAEARQMGEAGRRYVLNQFSIKKISGNFWNLVKDKKTTRIIRND